MIQISVWFFYTSSPLKRVDLVPFRTFQSFFKVFLQNPVSKHLSPGLKCSATKCILSHRSQRSLFYVIVISDAWCSNRCASNVLTRVQRAHYRKKLWKKLQNSACFARSSLALRIFVLKKIFQVRRLEEKVFYLAKRWGKIYSF